MPLQRKKITVPALRARKAEGPKIAAVTAYDATMATLVDDAEVDVILVGDSLGMVVQGQSNTIGVTVDDICYHSRAVAGAVRYAHIVGDMPFLSFQLSCKQAVRNAGKLIQQGRCESVKLEGGVDCRKQVEAIVRAGIPVMGHVGLTPQSVHAMGGFRVQGKDVQSAERVLQDAVAFEQAGAFSLVIEGVPQSLASRITESVCIPTIGIGAGAGCDGQILVCYDFLGMVRSLKPKFVKHFAEIGDQITAATAAYVSEVRNGSFPSDMHCFHDTTVNRSHSPSETPASESDHSTVKSTLPFVSSIGAVYGPSGEG